MILRALADYYDRLVDDPAVGIPSYGFAEQKVHFCLVLDRLGNVVQVEDLRQAGEKKPRPRTLTTSFLAGRTSCIKSFFLCDNTGYVLGQDGKGKEQKALDKFQAFKELHHKLLDDSKDENLRVVLRFLDVWEPERCPQLEHWDEMAGSNVVFRLDGERHYLHDYPEAIDRWQKYSWDNLPEKRGMCLLSGEENTIISPLHWPLKGVRDAQTTGAFIVSFNADAFGSYGKGTNSYNAPVSEERAFAYVTALNRLLAFGSRQKIQLGDSTMVFWTGKPSPAEALLPQLFNPDERPADDQGLLMQVRAVLEALREGLYPHELGDPSVIFYTLGISPNVSRLAVRFWSVSSVGELAEHAGLHFRDLALQREWDSDPEFPSLYRILNEPFTRRATGKKPDVMSEYPSTLSAALTRAVFTGSAYPRALLALTLGRIRADGQVNYLRAVIIKAFITRNRRLNNQTMEVGMALNPDSNDTGYLLGRLFAVLEKAQQDALGQGINTTIRDRYFSSASATPGAVFPLLLRLTQHHIQKAEYGYISDRRIEDITRKIDSFPAHLSLEAQGMFVLGYYHQRCDFYNKTNKPEEK